MRSIQSLNRERTLFLETIASLTSPETYSRLERWLLSLPPTAEIPISTAATLVLADVITRAGGLSGLSRRSSDTSTDTESSSGFGFSLEDVVGESGST